MKTLNLVLTALLSVSTTTAFAASKSKESKTATEFTYELNTKESLMNWKGTKKVGSFHEGGIKIKSGEFKAVNNEVKSGTFVVDMTTITNTDLKDADYNKKLVGHLSNEDFFNVTKYPTSTFVLTSFKKDKEADKYMVEGDLTMLDKTQKISFPATVKFENDSAMATGTVKVDRTKWGLKYGSGNFFKELAGDKIINDEFELTLNLKASKKK